MFQGYTNLLELIKEPGRGIYVESNVFQGYTNLLKLKKRVSVNFFFVFQGCTNLLKLMKETGKRSDDFSCETEQTACGKWKMEDIQMKERSCVSVKYFIINNLHRSSNRNSKNRTNREIILRPSITSYDYNRTLL